MARAKRFDRQDRYDSAEIQNAKVDVARMAPVSEKSSWVTPCWTMSPIPLT